MPCWTYLCGLIFKYSIVLFQFLFFFVHVMDLTFLCFYFTLFCLYTGYKWAKEWHSLRFAWINEGKSELMSCQLRSHQDKSNFKNKILMNEKCVSPLISFPEEKHCCILVSDIRMCGSFRCLVHHFRLFLHWTLWLLMRMFAVEMSCLSFKAQKCL